MRPSKHEYYLEIAKTVAKRSQDRDTQVGMIMVNPKTGNIISTGYNGFVREADDEHLPLTRPEKYEFFVHAEPNMLYNCARNGIATNGCVVYGTTTPCGPCLRALWQCGISEMWVASIHPTFKNTLELADMAVSLRGALNLISFEDAQAFFRLHGHVPLEFHTRIPALSVQGAKDPYSGQVIKS